MESVIYLVIVAVLFDLGILTWEKEHPAIALVVAAVGAALLAINLSGRRIAINFGRKKC